VAIPVSLVGSFFFMAAFGFTLNNLSLFGLVLAIGIVVDDAIVVVENVERNIAAGLTPREAARKSMTEVGSALIAIALVLCAVFVPSIFITGISGQFYRQCARCCSSRIRTVGTNIGGRARYIGSSIISIAPSTGWGLESPGWRRGRCGMRP
jgi:Cu/Ag efflux pump CusA